MIEPTLALQTALHDHLVSAPAVVALVDPINIRVGSSRPENMPGIRIANGIAMMRGHASGRQYVATVLLDLHLWAVDDGFDHVKTIGAAVAHRLMKWPDAADFDLVRFEHTRTAWPRDPDPSFGHGVMSVEADIQWKP